MKKLFLLFMVAVLVFSVCTAAAQEWTCPKCGRTNSKNFCPDCGTESPKWICSFCGESNFSAYCENCGAEHFFDCPELIGVWKITENGANEYLYLGDDGALILAAQYYRQQGVYQASRSKIAMLWDTGTSNVFSYTLSGDSLDIVNADENTIHAVRVTETDPGDVICEGIFIDGIDVSGMTKEDATAMLETAGKAKIMAVDMCVAVGNELWHVTSGQVPFTQNTDEIVETAWALGREDRVERVMLRDTPVYLTTKLSYDHEALRTAVDGIVSHVNGDPVNGMVESFDFSTKTFTFTEEKPGLWLDGDALYRQMCTLLDSGTYIELIMAEPEEVPAEKNRENLESHFGLISSCTLPVTDDSARNVNIQLSAAAVSGKTVLPGESFSFNDATGERSAENSYVEAPAVIGGVNEMGGGACQTSSALFSAVVRANLDILERNPHTTVPGYTDMGLEATVSNTGLDMKFRNNTDYPIFIVAGFDGAEVTVEIYGYNPDPEVTIMLESVITQMSSASDGTGRYAADTWKIRYRNGLEENRDMIFSSIYGTGY